MSCACVTGCAEVWAKAAAGASAKAIASVRIENFMIGTSFRGVTADSHCPRPPIEVSSIKLKTRLSALARLRRGQRIAGYAHMFARLEGRLGRIAEVAIAAVLHAHLHLIRRGLAHFVFDAVAGKATAYRARDRRERTAATVADLRAEQSARDRAAHGADAGRRFGGLHCVDRNDFTRIRVIRGGARRRRTVRSGVLIAAAAL